MGEGGLAGDVDPGSDEGVVFHRVGGSALAVGDLVQQVRKPLGPVSDVAAGLPQ